MMKCFFVSGVCVCFVLCVSVCVFFFFLKGAFVSVTLQQKAKASRKKKSLNTVNELL